LASWRSFSTGGCDEPRRLERGPVRIPGRNRFAAQTSLVGHPADADDVARRPSLVPAGDDIMRKLLNGVAAFAMLTGGGVFPH
jgi:hypothetical protein